ncbi:MAG TPA: arginase family protein, partial [bacterium]|nr:arginase family protein [bacterium]
MPKEGNQAPGPDTVEIKNDLNGQAPTDADFLNLLNTTPPFAGFGFGGAQFIELAELRRTERKGDLVFLGFDKELSRHFGDCNSGAAAFVREKTFCMMPWTQEFAAPSHDIGIVTCGDLDLAIKAISVFCGHIATLGCRPILVGCDHTASLAAALGVAFSSEKPPVYLYFDAHLDLGLHNVTPNLHNGNFVNFLLKSDRIAEVVNVGSRCWSSFVPVYDNVPRFSIVKGGVPHVPPEKMIEQLSSLKGRTLYVSLDADVLDPSCAPNVSCPEPFGMSAMELFEVCNW